jgi:hypothetical protein
MKNLKIKINVNYLINSINLIKLKFRDFFYKYKTTKDPKKNDGNYTKKDKGKSPDDI